MNVTQMISELRAERASIEGAIAVLERLVRSQPGRRGRPPKWLASAKAAGAGQPSPNGTRTKRVFEARGDAKKDGLGAEEALGGPPGPVGLTRANGRPAVTQAV